MKGVIRILALALVFITAAVTAEAKVVDLGALAPDVGGVEGNVINNTKGKSTVRFVDYYNFTTTTQSQIAAVTTNFNLFNFTNISGLHAKLLTQDENGKWFSVAYAAAKGALMEQITLQYANLLPAKDYRIVIAGSVLGGQLGNYSMNYQIAAVPLPPAVLAFLTGIFGLAVVGRKRQNSAA